MCSGKVFVRNLNDVVARRVSNATWILEMSGEKHVRLGASSASHMLASPRRLCRHDFSIDRFGRDSEGAGQREVSRSLSLSVMPTAVASCLVLLFVCLSGCSDKRRHAGCAHGVCLAAPCTVCSHLALVFVVISWSFRGARSAGAGVDRSPFADAASARFRSRPRGTGEL